ncbi:MAG: 23S rRNA (adenine(2503)-C(2))-methyltransferase [Bacteroidetes bacterium RIFCSPLOWO2_02_FULL_36_8]|nr:MAG: 23S rRNA (adenine(2503)-C(2))-methyltransferase [Bacteroidetes bacterium RIFCSPLOWO2_02_FULL_36_8]OFY70286.1 MAG: 23S rRNA (adenine(2503)-C(2))-methyltransferase [Bacteroidetes bacterium RIFCSPLOWO2_12_FULL_37_12]
MSPLKKQLTDIRQLSITELSEKLTTAGEAGYRAKQIYEWLWKKNAHTFENMSNLPLALRKWLEENFHLNPIKIHTKQLSSDGTLKLAFSLWDSHIIEGVLIPEKDRMTACISSQAGCSLTCSFCATGYLKLKRNLNAGEMVDQVTFLNKEAQNEYGATLTNIVFMGMGEPLLNYVNVTRAISMITSAEGLYMSSKRVTLSTAGIAKMITRLADDKFRCKLAVSLHAADDVKRSKIMPINNSNSLKALSDALHHFCTWSDEKVTFEYILLNNFNDSERDAELLLNFISPFPSKVNIIEYNPIKQFNGTKPSVEGTEKFMNFLFRRGVNVKIRRSRGKDIAAACGQLAGNYIKP